MKKFTVYFEIYGKKMKAVVDAHDEAGARNRIRDKIVFHKIEAQKERSIDDIFQDFANIFGGKP